MKPKVARNDPILKFWVNRTSSQCQVNAALFVIVSFLLLILTFATCKRVIFCSINLVLLEIDQRQQTDGLPGGGRRNLLGHALRFRAARNQRERQERGDHEACGKRAEGQQPFVAGT